MYKTKAFVFCDNFTRASGSSVVCICSGNLDSRPRLHSFVLEVTSLSLRQGLSGQFFVLYKSFDKYDLRYYLLGTPVTIAAVHASFCRMEISCQKITLILMLFTAYRPNFNYNIISK